MPAIRTLALVLRTVEVFETSLVATLFTRELGKVAVLAKGARRLKSPLQGGLDLLGVSDIVMFHEGVRGARLAGRGRAGRALSHLFAAIWRPCMPATTSPNC